MANCADCNCQLRGMTDAPIPEGAFCLICQLKLKKRSFFEEGPEGEDASFHYCWCGRQRREHYGLLDRHDSALYCRKSATSTFVAMPKAFESKEVRDAWSAFTSTLDDVPKEMETLMLSFVEWKIESEVSDDD